MICRMGEMLIPVYTIRKVCYEADTNPIGITIHFTWFAKTSRAAFTRTSQLTIEIGELVSQVDFSKLRKFFTPVAPRF